MPWISEADTQFCQKHPTQKLVQMACSSVCDVCDPPKKVWEPLSVREAKRLAFSLGALASPSIQGPANYRPNSITTAQAIAAEDAMHAGTGFSGFRLEDPAFLRFDSHTGWSYEGTARNVALVFRSSMGSFIHTSGNPIHTSGKPIHVWGRVSLVPALFNVLESLDQAKMRGMQYPPVSSGNSIAVFTYP